MASIEGQFCFYFDLKTPINANEIFGDFSDFVTLKIT